MKKIVVVETYDVVFPTGHNRADGVLFCRPSFRQEGVNVCGGWGFWAMAVLGYCQVWGLGSEDDGRHGVRRVVWWLDVVFVGLCAFGCEPFGLWRETEKKIGFDFFFKKWDEKQER
jgi:hypothetical protein